jgi:hypothetical protein
VRVLLQKGGRFDAKDAEEGAMDATAFSPSVHSRGMSDSVCRRAKRANHLATFAHPLRPLRQILVHGNMRKLDEKAPA